MRGQSVERAPDAATLLGPLRRGVGPLARVHQRAAPFLLLHPLGAEGAPARGALARAIGRDVQRDPKEPRVERRLPPERRERLERADERLLGDVERLLAVVQDVPGETVDPLPVLLDQGLERGDVAGAHPLDQGEIVELDHGSPAPPTRRRLDDRAGAAIHRRRRAGAGAAASASSPSR